MNILPALFGFVGKLIGPLFAYLAGRQGNELKHQKRMAKDARKDADIANRPSKRGSDLIDSLRGDDK